MQDRSGTTATVAMIVNNTLYMANVGDSTAVICKKNNPPAKITFDHKVCNSFFVFVWDCSCFDLISGF